ncbi:MAG: aminotransferase class V-fold PLP-dependent enzyme [Bryobacteraceae bacterium]
MSGSRREFLRGLTTAATLPASWMAFSQKVTAASTAGDGESFWRMVKSQFPLEEGLIYMNAANVCPASRPVLDRHQQYLRDFQSNPAFQNREKYAAMRERMRGKIASMLRVSADEIAITRNTSEGSNTVVQGLDLKPGDEVVITDQNHPSNNDSWKVRARRVGFSVRVVPVPIPAKSPEALVAGIEGAITPRTRVISVTHVLNTTGAMYPVRRIGEIARRRGIYFHLDGAQSFGAVDVNLREIGCDSYSTSAHKWPMGPLEAGILFIRGEHIARMWPAIVTAGWTDNLKGARKFEVFGQRDDPRVASLEAAIDFLQMIGMPRVESRLRELVTHAKTELKRLPDVALKTDMEPEICGGVIKFTLKNVPLKQAYDTLWERDRIAISLTAAGEASGLRWSPHIYNSPEEIDRAVAAVRALA